MTGPDEGAAARGRLRAAHADREQVIEVLKAAFVQGRLDKGEFDTRVGQVLTSRTYAELADLTADLPARAAAAQPPGPGRARAQQPVPRPARVIMAASLIYAGLWAFLLVGPGGGGLDSVVAEALALLTVFWVVTVIGAGIAMVASRQQKRRGRQLPPRPAAGAGGQASQPSRSAGPAGQIPPIEGGRPHAAEAARRRRSPARPCPAL